jgi:ubiquinone/menaquinone biosynthesis C-methylase UbiE/rRNA maturation protein Nop10
VCSFDQRRTAQRRAEPVVIARIGFVFRHPPIQYLSMRKEIRYQFVSVDKCNMCGSDAKSHKIIGRRLNQSQGINPKSKLGITTTIVKCSDCGLIYANPNPVPFDLQDHYGVPPEDYWKESYFVVDDSYFQHQIETIKKLADFKAGMKSLDIGAGLGKAMIALSNAGFDAYGFEPSKQFHERAITKMGIDPKKLTLGMIEQVEYPANNFDFISFGAVLEHLYDPSGSIVKALQWLKPGGFIHIEVPSSDWFVHKLINLFYRLRLSDYVGNLSPMHDPYHLYEFGLKSFEKHASQHNYEIAFHEYDVCHTYMPKVLDVVLKPYMKKTNTGMQLTVWLRKLAA